MEQIFLANPGGRSHETTNIVHTTSSFPAYGRCFSQQRLNLDCADICPWHEKNTTEIWKFSGGGPGLDNLW